MQNFTLPRISVVCAALALALFAQCGGALDARDSHAFGELNFPTELGFRALRTAQESDRSSSTTTTSNEAWADGPRAGFDVLAPRDLARASLAWFESSEPLVDLGDSTDYLELVYPSARGIVVARYTPGAEQTWEQQLAAWFEYCPPISSAPEAWQGKRFAWMLELASGNRIWGADPDRAVAVETLRSLSADLDDRPQLSATEFSLGQVTQQGGGNMAVWVHGERLDTTLELYDEQSNLVPSKPAVLPEDD